MHRLSSHVCFRASGIQTNVRGTTVPWFIDLRLTRAAPINCHEGECGIGLKCSALSLRWLLEEQKLLTPLEHLVLRSTHVSPVGRAKCAGSV